MKRLGQSNFELSFDELLANVAMLLAYQAYRDYFKNRDILIISRTNLNIWRTLTARTSVISDREVHWLRQRSVQADVVGEETRSRSAPRGC